MPAPQRSMSSQLENTSAILGEYMLKGWTLTDLQCDTCHVTPLMREPAAQASSAGRERIQFCAFCDGGPGGPVSQAGPSRTTAPPDISTPASRTIASDYASPFGPIPSIPSDAEAGFRASSSSAAPPAAPLGASESEIAARRGASSSATGVSATVRAPTQQARSSDDVSELISQRLLQGYSLLQTNCPNSACRGVPLIGYPRAKDGTRDPRRMCVSCGTGYVSEGAMNGLTVVQPGGQASGSSLASAAGAASTPHTADQGAVMVEHASTEPESPRSKRRRELYETGEAINSMRSEGGSSTTTKGQIAAMFDPSDPLDAARTRSAGRESVDEDDDDLDALLNDTVTPPAQHSSGTTSAAPPAAVASALNAATSSLALTLDRLAGSLASLTAGQDLTSEARYFVDVKLHTEAMRDVLEVLERVRRVQ